MATELNTPIAQEDATFQGVTKIEFRIAHSRNAGTGAMEIDRSDKSGMRYEVTTWNASGKRLGIESRFVPFTSWPSGFKSTMGSALGMIETDAKANGLIQAGTDEPL